MLSDFQWYRRMRGGRWARVTGYLFRYRWVRVSDECVERCEMPKRAIFNRLACSRAGVSVKAYRAGNLTPEQRMRWLTAVEELRALPYYLEDTGGMNRRT